MSEYMALNAIYALSDQLVAVRLLPKVAEFLKLVQAPGTTSVNIQTWLAANPGEVKNIFDNETVAKTLLSRSVWASLVYGSAIGITAAMNSATWVTALVSNPDNVNTLVSVPAGLSAIANSTTALDVIYFNRNGIGGGAYARFLTLSDTVPFSPPTTTSGGTAAVTPLSGRFILMSAALPSNWSSGNAVRWNGQVAGNAPAGTTHVGGSPLTTFAVYNATTVTVISGSVGSGAVMTFRGFPIP